MAPIAPLADMDLWCCFSDSDPRRHSPENTRPIGIDIRLTIYGFKILYAQDFFFLKYDLTNINLHPIQDIYFGIVLDADVGYWRDDLTGLILNKVFRIGSDTIRIKNTAFIYDYDNIERPDRYWQGGTPGAVAIRLLSAPYGLNLSAFKTYIAGESSSSDRSKYLMFAGYNWWQHPHPYAPYDSIDSLPDDKKFLMSSVLLPFCLALLLLFIMR